MGTTTVSPKFQIVIPKDVREQLHIKSGQKLSILVIKGVMHILPVEPVEKLEGFVKGVDTSDVRDEGDRF